ncbi:hypothetical protein [Nonomuraea endophytica]|uniref:hypothetical protein n=1 Tax=Nonomuraea endophytica TaxID=714136 RepID=UPI0037C95F14
MTGAKELGPVQSVALAPAILPIDTNFTGSRASLAASFTDGALFSTMGGVSPATNTGAWEPFRAYDQAPPYGPGARPGRIADVALVTVGGGGITDPNTYVCVTRSGPDPDIFCATDSSAGWGLWENLEHATIPGFPFPIDFEPGHFDQVSAAKTTEGLHVVGVASGQIFHQLRSDTSPIFRDVELVGAGQEVGYFVAVACG